MDIDQLVYMSHKVPHPDRVSVWGCFSSNGLGDLVVFTDNLDSTMMRNILKDHLVQSANRLFPSGGWWFLQDNDPKHTSLIVKQWLFRNGIQCIDFPPYSPDLNPIENLWNDLKRRVESHNAANIEELQQHLSTQWEETNADLLAELAASMPRRCRAARPGPTDSGGRYRAAPGCGRRR